ncbi:hypothetical protein [Paenibacillus sp. 32O-W]|uniref:hypothetical protein n=1 Tax=Paenibacillus sp. 32O-W TaxID=1695218 RepID=UPI0013966973|nr:hypothetical protein [Paenibacillus sp. 32O-W]
MKMHGRLGFGFSGLAYCATCSMAKSCELANSLLHVICITFPYPKRKKGVEFRANAPTVLIAGSKAKAASFNGSCFF